MDTVDYEVACLEQLEDETFYTEIPTDPNPSYSKQLKQEMSQLHLDDLITDSELSMLTQDCKSPAFYGLPKIHSVKPNDTFPPLRPICSGSQSCTKRLSELVDTFLKPAAQKLPTYIKDTTDFLRRIREFQPTNPSEVIIATLDVNSLYPNINQEEGAQACFEFLELRNNKSFPSLVVKRLILLVLQCNTLMFRNRFFHQTSGTAMGTPMAVNFANLFMGKFENEMLDAYEKQFKNRPAMWLRFIDDIFVVWEGNINDLNTFIAFVNKYAVNNNFASRITFKHAVSKSSVNFLDTKVLVQPDGTLATTLFNKPTASHNYLQRNSYHVSHAKNSLPKSQFIRIRRICSTLADYDHHAKKFVDHFVHRRYNRKIVQQQSDAVRAMSRESLLDYKVHQEQPRNTPLVITYHHKFIGIGRVLLDCFRNASDRDANFRKVFPEAPFVAYRRTKNIRDKLVRAKHYRTPGPSNNQQRQATPTKSIIERQMNHSGGNH